jgi:hypothetical protein
MKKSLFLSATYLLVSGAVSLFSLSSSAQNPTPSSPSERHVNSLPVFECRSRGTIFNIGLKTRTTYTVQSGQNGTTNPLQTLPGGRYTAFRNGFRFKTGELKNQSIVRQRDSIYLVGTANEAKAAEMAAYDGALFCTQLS